MRGVAGRGGRCDNGAEANAMISGVKATYSKGAIVPLEPLDLEEGADLSISIEVEPDRSNPASTTGGNNPSRTLDALYIEDYFEKTRR